MQKYKIVLYHNGVNKSIFVRANFAREAIRKAYRKVGAIYDYSRPNKYATLIDIINCGNKHFSL